MSDSDSTTKADTIGPLSTEQSAIEQSNPVCAMLTLSRVAFLTSTAVRLAADPLVESPSRARTVKLSRSNCKPLMSAGTYGDGGADGGSVGNTDVTLAVTVSGSELECESEDVMDTFSDDVND